MTPLLKTLQRLPPPSQSKIYRPLPCSTWPYMIQLPLLSSSCLRAFASAVSPLSMLFPQLWLTSPTSSLKDDSGLPQLPFLKVQLPPQHLIPPILPDSTSEHKVCLPPHQCVSSMWAGNLHAASKVPKTLPVTQQSLNKCIKCVKGI